MLNSIYKIIFKYLKAVNNTGVTNLDICRYRHGYSYNLNDYGQIIAIQEKYCLSTGCESIQDAF